MRMYKSFVGRTTVPTATRMCFGKVYSCMTDLMSSATLMTSYSHVSKMLKKVSNPVEMEVDKH